MEEPPKIERIVSSQGVSLSDTATILKAYLANIDQHHHHQPADSNVAPYEEEGDEEDITNNNTDNKSKTNNTTPRKSRQEREEEALIAQMDQLVNNNNTNKSKSGSMISDDVYERLKMITQSICAEVEGKPIRSAREFDNQVEMKEEEQSSLNNGANDFLAELEETERLAKEEEGEEQQKQQPTPAILTHRDKKKEKKAKKSAKKAKKEAKRKAKEMEVEDIANNDAVKRVKVVES